MTAFKELREALDAVEHSAMAFERCPDAHTGRRLNDARKKLLDRLEAAERDAERPQKMPNRMPLPHQSACDIEYSSGFDMGYAQGWNEAIDAMKEQQQ